MPARCWRGALYVAFFRDGCGEPATTTRPWCLESQLVVQTLGEYAADVGHRCEQRDWIGLAAQSIEHRQPPMGEELADGPGDALPHVRELLHRFQPTLSEELVQRLPHRPNRCRRPEIGANPERIGTLITKQLRRFLKHQNPHRARIDSVE